MVLVSCMGVFECVCVCGSEGWREGGGVKYVIYIIYSAVWGGSHAVFFAYVIWVGVFLLLWGCCSLCDD